MFVCGRVCRIVDTSEVFSLNQAWVNIDAAEMLDRLDQARAGDPAAFGEICRIHETRLLRQAFTLCGDPTLAADLAQETLVEAWRCLHRYNGRCQFFTWLCAILLNRYRNSIRAKRAVAVSALASHDQIEFQQSLARLADPGASPDEAARSKEQAAAVLTAIQALPAKQQQVIYLRFYVDDSLEGIAEALGCSVGTVKSRLFRALERLRGMEALQSEHTAIERRVETV